MGADISGAGQLTSAPSRQVSDCPWYDRGFCKHGPRCRNRHTRKTVCVHYLAGAPPLRPIRPSPKVRFWLGGIEVQMYSFQEV